jgi:hypothetical protein
MVIANPAARTELSTCLDTDVFSSEQLAVAATTRLSLTFTLRVGANCVCDAPKAADEDNLLAHSGAGKTDAEAIADVAAAMMSKTRNQKKNDV